MHSRNHFHEWLLCFVHLFSLSGNSEELLHSCLPATPCCFFFFSFLSGLSEVLHSFTDPLHPENINTVHTSPIEVSRQRKNEAIRCTYFTYLVWQRNSTKPSSFGSVQMSWGVSSCGAFRNKVRASLYFQKCGTGCVWREADASITLVLSVHFLW